MWSDSWTRSMDTWVSHIGRTRRSDMWARLWSFVWRDVSGTVRGGGNDGSNGSQTVVSSDSTTVSFQLHVQIMHHTGSWIEHMCILSCIMDLYEHPLNEVQDGKFFFSITKQLLVHQQNTLHGKLFFLLWQYFSTLKHTCNTCNWTVSSIQYLYS